MPQTLERTYAIGDIHGRADLLTLLHRAIAADAKGFSGKITLVYLGDYIDRGPETKAVLDILTGPSLIPQAERIFLMGNHEYAFIRFCEDPEKNESWLHRWGGAVMLQSYGIPYTPNKSAKELAKQMLHILPDAHAAFFDTLNLYELKDDTLFVHAGVRPNIPLEEQDDDDLLFIKEDFTQVPAHNLPYRIVFGHSIVQRPQLLEDRIAIDTGAYLGGPLTAVALEQDKTKFIQVRFDRN